MPIWHANLKIDIRYCRKAGFSDASGTLLSMLQLKSHHYIYTVFGTKASITDKLIHVDESGVPPWRRPVDFGNRKSPRITVCSDGWSKEIFVIFTLQRNWRFSIYLQWLEGLTKDIDNTICISHSEKGRRFSKVHGLQRAIVHVMRGLLFLSCTGDSTLLRSV